MTQVQRDIESMKLIAKLEALYMLIDRTEDHEVHTLPFLNKKVQETNREMIALYKQPVTIHVPDILSPSNQ